MHVFMVANREPNHNKQGNEQIKQILHPTENLIKILEIPNKLRYPLHTQHEREHELQVPSESQIPSHTFPTFLRSITITSGFQRNALIDSSKYKKPIKLEKVHVSVIMTNYLLTLN